MPHSLGEKNLPTLGRVENLFGVESDLLDPSLMTKWERTIYGPSAAHFLRVHIYLKHGGLPDGWSIVLIDSAGDTVDRLTPTSFQSTDHAQQAWSRRIPGHTATIRVDGGPSETNVRVGVDKFIYQFDSLAIQNFIGGHDDREDLVLAYGTNHRFYQWSRPVAQLTFVSSETQKETNCTAFLLTPSILLTNAHCLSESWQIHTAEVAFGVETQSVSEERFHIKSIILSKRQPDFSLLRLELPANEWGNVEFGGVPQPDEALVSIQQSNGGVKKVAVRKCAVQGPAAGGTSGLQFDFYHLCDSEGGSSGSPLMDLNSGRVVGLHRAGQWDPKAHDFRNLGVLSLKILSAIAACAPSVCTEIIGCPALTNKNNPICDP